MFDRHKTVIVLNDELRPFVFVLIYDYPFDIGYCLVGD